MSLKDMLGIKEEKQKIEKGIIIEKGEPLKMRTPAEIEKDNKLLLKQFKRFFENGFKRKDFTKRIYDHLHLHCGFIAHYDIDGFYSTYFVELFSFERFIDKMCSMRDYQKIEVNIEILKLLDKEISWSIL